jgi:hypothetical protein
MARSKATSSQCRRYWGRDTPVTEVGTGLNRLTEMEHKKMQEVQIATGL